MQRVTEASVAVDDRLVGAIGAGLLALVGIDASDTETDVDRMATKTAQLRLFAGHDGRFDRSLLEIGGQCLVVSQFTLLADTRKGRRPSFLAAAAPDAARQLVDRFVVQLRALGVQVETGEFGASMAVQLTNDGPVTLMLETP